MTLPDFPGITVDLDVCGGRPVVAGTRVRRQARSRSTSPTWERRAYRPPCRTPPPRATIRSSSPPNEVLIDAQLPPALAGWLERRGHEAVHVAAIGMVAASDRTIADRAEAEGSVLISKDEDFVILRSPDRFGFVWLRCGNASTRSLFEWLDERWPKVERLLHADEGFIEVR